MDQQTNQFSDEFHQVDEVSLDEVLQPYDQSLEGFEEGMPNEAEVYNDYVYDDYEDEHDAIESQGRFRIAMGALNLMSILVGMFVILVLVTLLLTLYNWVKTDILTSLSWFQSGLQ